MEIHRDNVKSLFDTAIERAEKEIRIAIACWEWARQSGFDPKWTEEAEEQIARVLGMKPGVFYKTCEVFGSGDLSRGAKVVERLGPARCASVLTEFAPTNQRKLIGLLDLDKVTPVKFDRQVDKLHKEISDHGKKLGEQRRERSPEDLERALRDETRTLKAELLDWKKKYAELKKRHEQLSKRLKEISEEVFQ